MNIRIALLLSVMAVAPMSSYAQTALTYSGCETPAEVRAAFEGTLSQDSLARLKIKEREALQRQVIENLLAKYPREYALYERHMSLLQYSSQDDAKAAFEAMRDRWAKNAKDHPEDALALLLAGKILVGQNTPEAIRLMEAAKAKAPEFPWPAHELSAIYWQSKFADTAKMNENLERFYSLCPAWTGAGNNNQIEGFRLQKNLPLMAKTATGLRAALEKETSPRRLADYQILWQREFLTRPPSEHDALRAQIMQDLKRLEALVPNGDDEWRNFLITGYKLGGASNEELERMRDKAAQDFPGSDIALSRLRDQFKKEHPRPDGQKDAAAWKAYYAANIELIKKMIREFPDNIHVQRSEFFSIAQEDEFISMEDGLAAMDQYLQAMEDYGGYNTLSFTAATPPRFLLDHGWQPERALELLKKTSTYKGGGHSKMSWTDSLADSDLIRFNKSNASEDRATLGLILKAAALSGKPAEALHFRAAVEEAPPQDKNGLEQYWTNRARFAALDKRPQDALVYYRLALDNRRRAPGYYHGLLRDSLMTEFHDCWTAQGGTEAAWGAWNPSSAANLESGEEIPTAGTDKNAAPNNQASSDKEKSAAEKKKEQQNGWKQVMRKMPPFELADFSGKTWRQKDLQGKVVLIVSWATWCAPCRMQDELLQKFYEKVKDRKDLAVLSFNVDENPGQVLPFIRKQKYTFPALAAFSYDDEARSLVPRTWIIDARGNWRWVRDGYDETKSYAEFEKELLEQIAKAAAEI